MGMFDYVHINVAKLPATPQERKRLAKATFQTKSLRKELSSMYITDAGFLETDDADLFSEEGETRTVGWGPDIIETRSVAAHEERFRLTDAHGVITFYAYEEGDLYSYNALFIDGRLRVILPDRPVDDCTPLPVQHGNTCRWSGELPVAPTSARPTPTAEAEPAGKVTMAGDSRTGPAVEGLPHWTQVAVIDPFIVFTFSDGRVLQVPLAWSEKLNRATPEQQSNVIVSELYAFWDDIDEIIGVENVLYGNRLIL